MKNKIVISFASAILLLGCASTNPKSSAMSPEPIIWESLEFKPAMESCTDIGSKYLKTHSFSQSIQEIASRSGTNIMFTPESEDVTLPSVNFRNWTDAVYWLDSRREFKSTIYNYASKDPNKTMDITRIAPDFLTLMSESEVEESSLTVVSSQTGYIEFEENTGSYAVDFNKEYDFTDRYSSLQRYLNDFSYFYKSKTGKVLYFRYDESSKSIYVTSKPQQIHLTPYKATMLRNFFNANNIRFTSSLDGNTISIEDNFMNWKKSINKVTSLNKYHRNVYGVKTQEGYYEIGDGIYPAKPLAIELITWTPYGEREYNVYYNNKSIKIVTKERDFSFYAEGTNQHFEVRTY